MSRTKNDRMGMRRAEETDAARPVPAARTLMGQIRPPRAQPSLPWNEGLKKKTLRGALDSLLVLGTTVASETL